MLRRLVVLAVTGLRLGVSPVAAAAPLASPVYTDLRGGDGQPTTPPVVTSTAVDGAVTVTVAGVGSTVEVGRLRLRGLRGRRRCVGMGRT